MTPPKLSTDTPVFDVFKPVAVGIFIFLWIELYLIVHDWGERNVGKVLHFEEPLCREFRLDGYVGTLGEAYFIVIVFYLFHQTSRL